MFLRKKLICNVCREYRSKASNRNPGIQRRIKIFNQENPEIENININESHLEDYESDFYNLSIASKHQEREEKNLKKIIHFKRIERKYFTPLKYPTLLTWAEKEQIKLLFNTDPVTWTPEKLALSFPATVDIIKKVLKSQWAPKDPERIKKHDESVANNWKAIKEGGIKLPAHFESHVKTFISRKESYKMNNRARAISLREDGNNTSGSTEFLSIIKSYKSKVAEDSSSKSFSTIDVDQDQNSETHITDIKQYVPNNRKYYTLRELRRETEKSLADSSSEPSQIDKHFVKGLSNSNKKEASPVDRTINIEIPHTKFKTNDSINMHKEENKEILKINIPSEKKKKGCVYKVNDCYYDNNGDFLYKVPGMA